MANNRIQVKRTSVSGRTANVTNVTNSQYIAAGELALNMPDGILYSSNGSALITVGANLVNQNITGNLTVKAIIANGSIGSAGETLTSNGSAVYWAAGAGSGTVTQVNTGNGMTGGPITTTGTVSILANTGVVANSTGLFVNSAYIGTLTANNTSFVGTVSAANVVSNAQLSGNLANYQTTAGLSANVATLTANNSNNLNGQPASYYTNATNITTGILPYAQIPANVINTTAAFTISGVHTYNANIVVGTAAGISANGGFGTAGQVLHSNGTSVYWAVDDQGVTSVATGNGLVGGTITTTGTVSILANTGIVANATGTYVNATYIGTLTANNATNLGGVAAASYVQNTDSRTLSGNLVISGTYFNPSSNTILLGNSTQRWVLSANTGSFSGAVSGITTLAAGNTTITGFINISSTSVLTGNVAIGTTNTTAYALNVNGSFAATTKSFVINHPTKEGQKLRYASLEGPENGVYVRGRLDDKSIIELPDYWWNLIDESTITVNLTPIGRSQDIWVQSTSAYFIHLNQPADCFFTVFAERKDVDKLVVEY